jgi:hypothetical protein
MTERESPFYSRFPGREEPFPDEGERHVAVLRVTLSHKPGSHSRSEDGLRCVADRAAARAAGAYNFFDTRIASVEVIDVERVDGEAPHTLELIFNNGWDAAPEWKAVCSCGWEVWNQPDEITARSHFATHVDGE